VVLVIRVAGSTSVGAAHPTTAAHRHDSSQRWEAMTPHPNPPPKGGRRLVLPIAARMGRSK